MEHSSSIQKFIKANLSSGSCSIMHKKAGLAMMASMANNEEVAREAIEQGALDFIIQLPQELSSEVANFVWAVAGSSEANANLLVRAPGVVEFISNGIRNNGHTAVLIAKKIAEYIGSPAREAVRESHDIVVGLCGVGTSGSCMCNDALDALADLARNSRQVQDVAGAYVAEIVKGLSADNRKSSLSAVSSIVHDHFDNQMKFIEVLAGDEECLARVLSERDGVSCVLHAMHHPSKRSTQRTALCKIVAFRKIVSEGCAANDDAFKTLVKALCSGHSGNHSRFLADGFVFTEDLDVKCYKKRKATQTHPDSPETECAPTTTSSSELHVLKCENEMLHAEIAEMRRRLASAVCQVAAR